MNIKMIYIDQYFAFQGAPDRAGQPLQAAVTLQYKASEEKRTYSENTEISRQKEIKPGFEDQNQSLFQHQDEADLFISINILRSRSHASRSLAASHGAATDKSPRSKSLLNPGVAPSMRAYVMLPLLSAPTPIIIIPPILCYQVRGRGSQPRPGAAAVIQVAAAHSHAAISHVIMIGHAITWRDNDPAYIRTGCPGLNQQSAPAGLRDVIVWALGCHLYSALSPPEVVDRKSISELTFTCLYSTPLYQPSSISVARFTYHLSPILRHV